MVGNQTMIAIGIGCRRGTPAAAIEALIRQALDLAPRPLSVMAGEGQLTTIVTGEPPPPIPATVGDGAREGGEGPAPVTAMAGNDIPPLPTTVVVGGGPPSTAFPERTPDDDPLISFPPNQSALFTIEDKANEPGLIQAAHNLNLNLTFLPRAALRAQTDQTPSRRTESLFGVPSVAEAAALAGAGPNATLIVPRITAHGVTCAIATNP